MALVAQVWALLMAQMRNVCNRTLRDSGLTGMVTTGAVLLGVGLVLALPGLVVLRIGFELGKEVAAAFEPQALRYWCGFQAVFTVGFAGLGGLRHRLCFSRRDLGIYPLRPVALLAAEIPAGIIEVFPLLGTMGIVCTSIGFAIALPRATPGILVLAVQGIVWMLILQHLAGSVRRWVVKRRAAQIGFLALGLATMLLGLAEGDPRPAIRAVADQLMIHLPGSIGYQGLLDMLSGSPGLGLGRIVLCLLATLALLMITAWVHSRELVTESSLSGRRRQEPPRLDFRRPAGGLGRLFFKQLLDSHFGLLMLFFPLLAAAGLDFFLWALRLVASRAEAGEVLPGPIVGLTRLHELPLFELFLFATVWMGIEIFSNQFGWDGRGLRTLLILPLPVRQILLGKLYGLARFLGLQLVLSVPFLLPFYRPSGVELISGVGGAGAAFMVVVAGGHLFSARFPRLVEATGTSGMPLHLSWIPGLTMVILGLVFASVRALAMAIAPWVPALFMPLLFAAAVAGYRVLLPTIARQVTTQQERLLGM